MRGWTRRRHPSASCVAPGGSSEVRGRSDRLPTASNNTEDLGPRGVHHVESTTIRTGTAALILVGALGFGPGLAASNAASTHQAASRTSSMTTQGQAWNYTGTWTDKKGRTGQAVVSIVPQKFWNDGGDLMMRSKVTSTLHGARGSVPHTKTMDLKVQDVTTGAATSRVSAASCDIVNLVLGPLDLNILGLEVHLNQVVLDIIGTLVPATCWATCSAPWPACSTAALPWEIANLLNQILAILNGLGA